MTKPIVVLIHGMGNHTAPKVDRGERGSFGRECIDSFNTALQMYPALRNQRIEDSVNFVEIHYNHLFDKIRQQMAQNGEKISSLMGGAPAAFGGIPGFVQSIIDFESSLDGDDVIFTHWLDVILYKLHYGEFVRTHVAEKLGDIISRNSTSDIHILAHSLGSAVIHDSLHKIYNHEYAEEDNIADLSPATHKLASVWQIANVSRLANSVLPIADPYKTLVKPGMGLKGITRSMMNIHHRLDPFTRIKPFKRTDNGKWISNALFRRGYKDIETTDITEINTHSITQYLHDPAVHLCLFQRLGIKRPPPAQRKAAAEQYKNLILQDAKTRLQEKFDGIVTGNSATFKEFFDSAKALKEVMAAWGNLA